jgi:hypothetical protein
MNPIANAWRRYFPQEDLADDLLECVRARRFIANDNVLYHALSRRKGSPREDGDAIEFHDLGDGVLAIFMK